MKDISTKITTLRTAIAESYISFSSDTFIKIKNGEIEKGDIFEFARSASFFAAKNTSGILPHCHPVLLDGFTTSFELVDNWNGKAAVRIVCEGKCVGRTGIEMEALTAVSVAALTIYDMLKPHDKQLEISGIKLLEKKGGKSERIYFKTAPTCAVLLCSTATANKKRDDEAAQIVLSALKKQGIESCEYLIVKDEKALVQTQVLDWVKRDIAFIFTVGGTGLGEADHAVSAVEEILERNADGIIDALRSHGIQRSPLAMMSRLAAGSIAHTTIVTIPGSTAGASEAIDALLPAIFHARKMLKGGDKHE
jgi:molybdenum cofactor biosynthesis protein MoaC